MLVAPPSFLSNTQIRCCPRMPGPADRLGAGLPDAAADARRPRRGASPATRPAPSRSPRSAPSWAWTGPSRSSSSSGSGNLLQGDFGESYYYKTEVTTLIGQRLEPTLSLALITIVWPC
jgi:hypothetical protein